MVEIINERLDPKTQDARFVWIRFAPIYDPDETTTPGICLTFGMAGTPREAYKEAHRRIRCKKYGVLADIMENQHHTHKQRSTIGKIMRGHRY